MGADKASVVIGDRTLLQRTVDILHLAGCRPVIALHRNPDSLSDLDVPIRRDLGGGQGPLDGLVSALTIADTPVVVTLPVDLPRLVHRDVELMMSTLADRPDLDAVGLTDDLGTRQHLATAWRRDTCLEHLREAFDRGERSVRLSIELLGMGWHVVPAGHLLNANSPTDLDVEH